MTTTHQVKTWPEFYQPIADGSMPFNIRRNDRHYKPGDKLHVLEWDDKRGVFTGREVMRTITFVMEGIGPGAIPPLHGLLKGYCILGLSS